MSDFYLVLLDKGLEKVPMASSCWRIHRGRGPGWGKSKCFLLASSSPWFVQQSWGGSLLDDTTHASTKIFCNCKFCFVVSNAKECSLEVGNWKAFFFTLSGKLSVHTSPCRQDIKNDLKDLWVGDKLRHHSFCAGQASHWGSLPSSRKAFFPWRLQSTEMPPPPSTMLINKHLVHNHCFSPWPPRCVWLFCYGELEPSKCGSLIKTERMSSQILSWNLLLQIHQKSSLDVGLLYSVYKKHICGY